MWSLVKRLLFGGDQVKKLPPPPVIKAPPVLNKYEQILKFVDKTSVKTLKIRPVLLEMQQIESLAENLREVNRWLEKHNAVINNKQLVDNQWHDGKTHQTNLEKFICRHKGFYTDPNEEVGIFLTRAHRYASLMITAPSQSYGYLEHNDRVLHAFTSTVLVVSEKLAVCFPK